MNATPDTSTIIRRNRSKILSLKDQFGEWCHDPDILRNMVRHFYVNLYFAEPCAPCNPDEWHFPNLNHAERRWLNRRVSPVEVKEAFFQMGAYKAPGPDGILPLFYWHVVGCINFVHWDGDVPFGLELDSHHSYSKGACLLGQRSTIGLSSKQNVLLWSHCSAVDQYDTDESSSAPTVLKEGVPVRPNFGC